MLDFEQWMTALDSTAYIASSDVCKEEVHWVIQINWKMATFDRHQGKDEVHDFASGPRYVSRSLEQSQKQHSRNLVSI